jgi:hypothetical protein
MSRLSVDDPAVVAEVQTALAALGVGTQGAVVADPAAATASNPTAPAALTQLAAPAGGTGATAGAYDSAANRDLAIASINAVRTDLIAARVEIATYEVAISALIVDVASVRTQLSALLTSLETGGIIDT